MKGRACVRISYEKLERVLNLRPGVNIRSVRGNPRMETAELFIEGDGLIPHGRRMEIVDVDLRELMDID